MNWEAVGALAGIVALVLYIIVEWDKLKNGFGRIGSLTQGVFGFLTSILIVIPSYPFLILKFGPEFAASMASNGGMLMLLLSLISLIAVGDKIAESQFLSGFLIGFVLTAVIVSIFAILVLYTPVF